MRLPTIQHDQKSLIIERFSGACFFWWALKSVILKNVDASRKASSSAAILFIYFVYLLYINLSSKIVAMFKKQGRVEKATI